MSQTPSSSSSQHAASASELSLPLDLSHHFAHATKIRAASNIKLFYRFFQIPGIGNLAGGLPNASLFPFDTLEAQVAKPDRWTPTPNVIEREGDDVLAASFSSSAKLSDSREETVASSHMTVPKTDDAEADPLKKIDISTALQYGTSAGYPPLASFVRQFTRNHLHPNVPYRNGPEIILTCGSTDGFHKAVELIVEPWVAGRDPIEDRPAMLCELYVYLNGPNTVKPKGARIVPVEIDDEGMLAHGPGGLKHILDNWDLRQGRRPHFMYTVTMGHNPTSGVLSVKRRKEIYAICQKYDIIIVEDDPYWYLQFPSAAHREARSRGLTTPRMASAHKPAKSSGFEFLDSLVPSYLSIDTDGRVIRLDTFSKTIAPGCRLGWITTQPAFIERLVCITETTTAQPSGFVQATVAQLILGTQPEPARQRFLSLSARDRHTFESWQVDGWVRWLEGLRGSYERRMNAMCAALDEHAYQLKQSTPARGDDSDWGVITKTRLLSFSWPRGGMFVWVRVHFEEHPLWKAEGTPGGAYPVIDGPTIAKALMAFATHEPYRVLVAPGTMFGATPEVTTKRAWRYFRLCFAAEAVDEIEPRSRRFGVAIQKFWRIKKVEEIEALVRELGMDSVRGADAEGVSDLGFPLGC